MSDPFELSPVLERLWARCEPSDGGMTPPVDPDAFLEQTIPHRLGIAFRHAEHERPADHPRVLHSEGVVGLVRWQPVVQRDRPLGGLLGLAQTVLVRLSNTFESVVLKEPGDRTNDDFLLGAAFKFHTHENVSGNLLFVTTPRGLPRPAFFSRDRLLTTRVENVALQGRRALVAIQFAMAVDALRDGGFPSPPDKDTLPLGPPLVAADLSPALASLALSSRVDLELPARPDFREILCRSLEEDMHIYDVVGKFEDGVERRVATLHLHKRFRISRWADEHLFFTHPGSGGSLDNPDGRRIAIADGLSLAQLEQRGEDDSDRVVRWRYRSLFLLKRGASVGEVASSVGYAPATIQEIAKRYNDGGPAAIERGSDQPLPRLRPADLDVDAGRIDGAKLLEKLRQGGFQRELIGTEWVHLLDPDAE